MINLEERDYGVCFLASCRGIMGYTSERNNQIVIELLKYHGIKRIIVSPGATNVSFVASVQEDNFFEIYSCVDERSAAYIACGMAAEAQEPVVLSCTGATASRNYLPGLTEAFYRHLPVLAITSTMPISRIGHNIAQCIDRTNVLNDITNVSVHIPLVKDDEDEWICNVRANEAMLELTHNMGGPAHINLETDQGGTFEVQEIKSVKPINRIMYSDNFPDIDGKIAIFVGSHPIWSKQLYDAVEIFCEKYNAVVLTDHTSNYKGKYGCQAGLISAQRKYKSDVLQVDTLIHIGDVSGAYLNIYPQKVWRVSKDGKLCDHFRKLRYVFEMSELDFFSKMNGLVVRKEKSVSNSFLAKNEYGHIVNKIPDLPFSNLWVAQNTSQRLPDNCVLHLGILNSLRSWNFFEVSETIACYSNTGGFGIDGCISSLVGAALVKTEKLYFGIVGDLAFFYDMNILGNRHYPPNIRLMIINNGRGQEFKNYGHRAAKKKKKADDYIAAAGHFGNQSKLLIKNFAENLGFIYYSANSKKSFLSCIDKFTSNDRFDKPIIFEIFTSTIDESEALKIIDNLENNNSATESAKQFMKRVLGDKSISALKSVLKR